MISSIIGAAITAATAATSAGMAAKQANDARRTEEKNRAEIEQEQRRRENLFNRRYHQDMTDRTEVQAMLRELREQQDAQRGLDETRGAVLGETKEQQLAEQNSRNRSYAEGLAGMTRNASTLKDSYLDRYENSMANYYQQRRDANTRTAQMQQAHSNQLATAASNAMNAATGMGLVAAGAMNNGGAQQAAGAEPPKTFNGPKLDTAPTPIGSTGMKLNPDGTVTNPKMNPWDRINAELDRQYALKPIPYYPRYTR